MAAIKNLLIELQNKYGKDLEDLPKDFDMQKYLQEKADENGNS